MKLEHLVNYMKGFLMGTADLVPGVSGGTVALLVGIYPRLISALSAPTHKAFWAAVRAFEVREVLRMVDFTLLFAVGLGAITAVFTLVSAIAYLLDNQPHLLLGFFFGLVLASAVYVCTLVRQYRPAHLWLALLGLVVTFLMGTHDPTPNAGGLAWSTYFFGGMIAVAAMLMPGVSGSLLLVNMGIYSHIVHDIRDLNPSIIVFCLGALCGLLVFARVLRRALARHHDELMAAICGILLSSLYLIWPWKRHVDGIPFSGQPNLLPRQYPTDPETIWVILLGFAGMALIVVIHRLAQRRTSGPAGQQAQPQ